MSLGNSMNISLQTVLIANALASFMQGGPLCSGSCSQIIVGRYLSIQHLSSPVLNLCEVVVNSSTYFNPGG